MPSAFESKKKEVLDVNRKLAFKCIDAVDLNDIKRVREEFVKDVEKRRNTPKRIHQGDSSLCGPASFMYCVAREKPDEFADYALDLALTGEARLGGLKVAPGQACRDVEKPVGKKGLPVAPADWVTLASLRDSTGLFSSMDSARSDAGGMTFPIALAGWFKETGWFSEVRNNTALTRTGINDPLRHLLGINPLPLSYVCLLIDAAITQANGRAGNVPTHWVVLGDGAGTGGGSNGNDGTVIRITTPGMKMLNPSGSATTISKKVETPYQHEIRERISCLPDSPACVANNDPMASRRAELEKGTLDFRVYTWGDIQPIRRPAGLSVEEFLTGYFGYVAAKVK
ncbi:MAG: hypothetical protein LBK55_06610 [Azoarcus sp.]|jgi:hypothetical protein|nr:hypothetical protein [Azoarcus sp.]